MHVRHYGWKICLCVASTRSHIAEAVWSGSGGSRRPHRSVGSGSGNSSCCGTNQESSQHLGMVMVAVVVQRIVVMAVAPRVVIMLGGVKWVKSCDGGWSNLHQSRQMVLAIHQIRYKSIPSYI